jgi:hypothetical protein
MFSRGYPELKLPVSHRFGRVALGPFTLLSPSASILFRIRESSIHQKQYLVGGNNHGESMFDAERQFRAMTMEEALTRRFCRYGEIIGGIWAV